MTAPSPTRPLRVVHYHRAMRLADGGIVRFLLDLCGVTARRGHAVTLLTADAADVPAEWRSPGGRLPFAPPALSTGFAKFLSRDALARAADLIAAADVLHLHCVWAPHNHQLARLARAAGVPYVVTAHGMLDDWTLAQKGLKKRLFLRAVGRRFLERAARVHCTADGELQQARKAFPNGRGIVVPCVFDADAFVNLPGPSLARSAFPAAFPADPAGDLPVLLFLSRLHPKKRVELLIDAAGVLRDAGERFRVVVAGPGEDDYVASLRARVAAGRLDDVVHFVGMVGGALKASLFQASRAFVLPTSQENFGLALVEAMACGTPVVTTKGVDIWPELRAAGATVVEADTPAAIAEAVRPFLRDAGLAAQVGEQGRRWVEAELAVDAVAGRYEAMYAAAVDEGRGSR